MRAEHTIKTVMAAPTLLAGNLLVLSLTFGLLLAPAADGQETGLRREELRAGRNFIPPTICSAEEDAQILKLFDGLRVSDVSDGMDKVGLTNTSLMSPEVHAACKDTLHYTHRFIGIAVTVRYVATNRPPAPRMDTEPSDRWVGKWYGELSGEPFAALIRDGRAVVIDAAPDSDVGSIVSNNIMGWHLRCCVGVVANATACDTDEIATEKMPLYFRMPGRGIRPGRNEIESVNRPIVCGGVLVMPGDVIVTDGDGVIVVPRAQAKQVAEYARRIIEGDKAGRRQPYKKLGLPSDDWVK